MESCSQLFIAGSNFDESRSMVAVLVILMSDDQSNRVRTPRLRLIANPRTGHRTALKWVGSRVFGPTQNQNTLPEPNPLIKRVT
ncbi:hypothetical protein PGT21_013918 [Puccinia graminis f. sp. tritici]|uniref:Uncharacterized protein n=1 Tax=Puccinia graminis f. sp. tritici TaxID=56615 RepID=A0A5B0NY47_PUCGR|nr:hypothetical protein PGT21_013918 [Puccinia graminis f. sp. tritici]KAA1093586.1 hypothetical protein PGTUg99_029451 [Puccinia graminis f. sp. tritici]